MAENVLQEVKAKMKELRETKQAELDKIHRMTEDALNKIEAAGLAMKKATEEMNEEDYAAAKEAKQKATTAKEMYDKRYKQIAAQEYISEEESDKIIDSLLAFENQLAADFKKDLAEELKKLKALYKGYADTVQDTENTIRSWEQSIHRNYNSRGASYWTNPDTGETTTRSATPIPVHRLPYTGCNEAHQLKEYIDKAAGLY
jgi:hypothetical protein